MISSAVAAALCRRANDPRRPDRAGRLHLILVNPRHLPRRARPDERLAIPPLEFGDGGGRSPARPCRVPSEPEQSLVRPPYHHAPSLPRRPRKEQQTRTAAFPPG